MQKPTLIIFTEGHPDIDTGFIAPELNIININFRQIFVYPVRWDSKLSEHIINSDIILKPDLARFVKSISPFNRKFAGLLSSHFWQNIFKIKLTKVNSLLNTCGYVSLVGSWISRLDFLKSETIFYTYWLTAPTLALSRLKEKGKIEYVISRIHGFDLYDERGEYVQNYFKPYIFKNITKVFCISEFGKRYLSIHYSHFSDKFSVSYLGTFNKSEPSYSKSELFEIVSCSILSPVKRIEYLIEGLSLFQKKYQAIPIRWTHIGGGPLEEHLKILAKQKMKDGTFLFLGQLSGQEISNLYISRYFNCFVNVSESEGIPVSIMEAQSFGIPVIATAVGGTPEIVDNSNGLLLAVNPTSDEIADALYFVYSNTEDWQRRRVYSKSNWKVRFNAESNYKGFGEDLISLMYKKE